MLHTEKNKASRKLDKHGQRKLSNSYTKLLGQCGNTAMIPSLITNKMAYLINNRRLYYGQSRHSWKSVSTTYGIRTDNPSAPSTASLKMDYANAGGMAQKCYYAQGTYSKSGHKNSWTRHRKHTTIYISNAPITLKYFWSRNFIGGEWKTITKQYFNMYIWQKNWITTLKDNDLTKTIE